MAITGLSGVFGFHKQPAVDMPAKGPYNSSGATTVQTLTLSGVSSGSFTLMVNGMETASIAYNATGATMAGNIDSAIEGVVGAGNVAVTGTGPFTITFANDYDGQAAAVSLGKNGTNGSVTVATTTKGGTWYWMPATSVNFQPNQIVQAIPPEVGGDLFSRGSYKGGVSGQGQVSFIARGGIGLGHLIHGFCGNKLVSGTDDSDYDNLDINKLIGDGSNGVESGAIKYRFTPASSPSDMLPWFTIVRNVGGKFVEEFSDARLGNFSIDVAATNLANVDASFVARKFGTLGLGSAASSPNKQVAANGPCFQAIDATVKLDSNSNGVPSSVVENSQLNPTRVNIALANQLSQNEFVVGDYYLQDVTNQMRTAQVTYSVYLNNPELYSRAYMYGASIDGGSDQAWSSKVWKGALELTLEGGEISGASGEKYLIKITVPEMDYMATPISLAGNNLVEYQLTTNVVLSQNPAVKPFIIEYTTDEDIF